MEKRNIAIASVVSALLAAAAIAGCGGGGGGYSAAAPPPPTPTPAPSPTPTPAPSPTSTPGLTLGNMNVATGGTWQTTFTYAPAANDTVVFSCGCSTQAGLTTTDVNGNFTVLSPASPTPAAPNPTYTIVPTRNYLVVSAPPGSNGGPQGWTVIFAGSIPSHDLALGDSGSVPAASGISDVFTTAVALYMYHHSTQNTNQAFDDWNFNSLEAWAMKLKTTPTSPEKTLLNDIAAQSAASASLFPAAPLWNTSQLTNATIKSDLNQITIVNDPSVPTPCPGGQGTCTGTPTP